jgi:SAM-dependent methyltransferase
MSDEGFQVGRDAPANYERFVAAFMLPFADAVVAHSGVRPGSAVLDVACGTGFVTRRLAAAVAPNGRVVGLDVNPHMLAAAAASCPPGIEWVESSAVTLPFGDAEFDAVTCQQGVQFFSDREAALREMHRVLRPRGRAVATIWAPPGSNPYQAARHAAMLAEGDLPEGMMAAIPDDGDRVLVDAASAGGFAELEVLRVDTVAALPRLDDFIPGQMGSTPWGVAYAALDDAGRARVHRRVEESLAPYLDADGSANVPFASHLLIATKAS